eukprot:COSAG04_NODE_81_length_27945_cov_46.142821_12_plen_153_part_00
MPKDFIKDLVEKSAFVDVQKLQEHLQKTLSSVEPLGWQVALHKHERPASADGKGNADGDESSEPGDQAIDDFIEEEELRSAQKPGVPTWLKDPEDEGDEEAQMSPGIDGGALDEFEAILPSENSPRRPKISPKRMQEISVRLHRYGCRATAS